MLLSSAPCRIQTSALSIKHNDISSGSFTSLTKSQLARRDSSMCVSYAFFFVCFTIDECKYFSWSTAACLKITIIIHFHVVFCQSHRELLQRSNRATCGSRAASWWAPVYRTYLHGGHFPLKSHSGWESSNESSTESTTVHYLLSFNCFLIHR